MSTFNLKEKVVAFFAQNPVKQATNREIAEWIVQNYPDDCAQKIQNSTRLADDANPSELAGTIVHELSSRGSTRPEWLLGYGIERIQIDGKWRWYRMGALDRAMRDAVTKNSHTDTVTDTSSQEIVPERKDIKEEDMYPILTKFLQSKLGVYSKRIDEKRSKNSRGARGNMWLYPDLVGLEDLSKDWDTKIKDCVDQYSDKKSKLWSFEVKKEIKSSNIREIFFQAVSNSSWANFGYLVAYEIHENSFGELRILSSLHGIGIIRLNIKEPSESQILIPAKEKMEIDWNIANRLVRENKDFKDYIEQIKDFCMIGKINESKWD